MKCRCSIGSPYVSRGNITGHKNTTCVSTIQALQQSNIALKKDLEQCLDILRDARAFTDEVEKVLFSVPAFIEFIKQHMHALMLLQHGVFLENATAMFHMWHNDREKIIERFEREARDAYERYQRNFEDLVEQNETEVERLHSEWSREFDLMKATAEELREQLMITLENEKLEKETKNMILKKAALLIERKQNVGCNKSTQVAPVVFVTSCQTEDVYYRSIASQTSDSLSEQRNQTEEEDPEPFYSVPKALPLVMPSAAHVQHEMIEQKRQKYETEIDALHLELQQLQLACAQEQEAKTLLASRCSILEEKLQTQTQEIAFLRNALDCIEMNVFSPSPLTEILDDTTLLEHLASAGTPAGKTLQQRSGGRQCQLSGR